MSKSLRGKHSWLQYEFQAACCVCGQVIYDSQCAWQRKQSVYNVFEMKLWIMNWPRCLMHIKFQSVSVVLSKVVVQSEFSA